VRATRELGLEGVVAKRAGSRYEPGRRTRSWIKVKHRNAQEFVVGGWLPGQGGRSTTLGALLVGVYDDGALRFAGRVGTGFSDADLRAWTALLAERALDHDPFTGGGVPRDARFVRPELVVEVAFTEWTGEGRLRHPVLLGRRDDIDPATVRREG
jgi:bifunctional non-homologous end joining protein LigD